MERPVGQPLARERPELVKSGAGWGRRIVKDVGPLDTLYFRAGEPLRSVGPRKSEEAKR